MFKNLDKFAAILKHASPAKLGTLKLNMMISWVKVCAGKKSGNLARLLLKQTARIRIYSSYANCNSTVGFFLED